MILKLETRIYIPSATHYNKGGWLKSDHNSKAIEGAYKAKNYGFVNLGPTEISTWK